MFGDSQEKISEVYLGEICLNRYLNLLWNNYNQNLMIFAQKRGHE